MEMSFKPIDLRKPGKDAAPAECAKHREEGKRPDERKSRKRRIIDSHCHIYPKQIALKAVENVDRFYDGLPGAHLDGTPETLLFTGKGQGISKFIVHSVATKSAQADHINRFIASAVKMAGGAFTGLGTLHPDTDDLIGDLDRLQDLGLKGVKLHPDIQQFQADEAKACRIYELCQERGLPVLIHAGDHRYDFSGPKRIAQVLRMFPELKLVAAHLGGWSEWDEAASLLPQYPNVIVDTSSSFQFLSVERAREIIRAYGADRVMFGTDYPMWAQKPDLDFMERMELTDEEYEQIYWRNCAQLYGMSNRGRFSV